MFVDNTMFSEKLPDVDIQALLNMTTSMMDFEKDCDLEWDLSAPTTALPLNDNDAMQQAEDLTLNSSATYTQLSILKSLDANTFSEPMNFSSDTCTNTSNSDVISSFTSQPPPATRPTRLPSVSTFKLSPEEAFLFDPINDWSTLPTLNSMTSLSPTMSSSYLESPTSLTSLSPDPTASLAGTPVTSASPDPISASAVVKTEPEPVPPVTSHDKPTSPKPKRRKSRARKHSHDQSAGASASGSASAAGASATAAGATRKFSSHVLPPCRVCGAQATGFHYGANTCEPCKVRSESRL